MKAGAKTIIAGIILFLMGAFVIPLAVVLSLIFDDSIEEQFKIPTTTQVTIEEPGRYYLWHEYQTIFKGISYNRSKSIPDGIEIKIRNKKTGKLYEFVSDTSISSSGGGNSKNSIGYIEIHDEGNIDITIAGGDKESIFSFSQFGLWRVLGLIFGGIGLSMIICLSGFGLAIWGIINVAKSNKKNKQTTPAQGKPLG